MTHAARWPHTVTLAAAATLVLALTIAVLMLTPQSGPPGVPDKTLHLLAFGALAFPLPAARARLAPAVIAAAALYGGAIELIQPHVGRSGDLADFLADAAGALLGAAAGALACRLLRGRRRG